MEQRIDGMYRHFLIFRLDLTTFNMHGEYKYSWYVQKCLLPTSTTYCTAATLHDFFLQAEIYTKDPDTHSTVLEEMEDKSQRIQTKTEKQVQTSQTNREAQTTGEGQLLRKYKR